MKTLTADQLIIEARQVGLNSIKNIPAGLVRSVEIEIQNQKFNVFPNGDVEAPDGYIYSIAKIHNNGLIAWEF